MKKALIAGASAAVLAAMPVAGVFAATRTITISDKLSTTVDTACSFTRTAVAAEAQDGITPTWTADQSGTGGTYTVTLAAGKGATLGTSSFTAFCNVNGGFTVEATVPANLTSGSNDTIAYSTTALTAGTNEGYTIQKKDNAYLTQTDNKYIFMSANGSTVDTDASRVTESATYKVSTLASTEAGTYEGTVTYTFTAEDPNYTAGD